MVALGKNTFIFEGTGRTCYVLPFADELGVASNIPIVDGAIAYDCPYSRHNALYIKLMHNNLIPRFIMRARGVTVNDVPKIHCDDPTVDGHSTLFPKANLRIPLQLIGTFSYFHTQMPTATELYDCDKLFIIPDTSDWNPYCLSFERYERAMLNYEGELVCADRRLNFQMERDDEVRDFFDISDVSVDHYEKFGDAAISSVFMADESPVSDSGHVNDDDGVAHALSLRGEISKFAANIGSWTISDANSSRRILTLSMILSLSCFILIPSGKCNLPFLPCELESILVSTLLHCPSYGLFPSHLPRQLLIRTRSYVGIMLTTLCLDSSSQMSECFDTDASKVSSLRTQCLLLQKQSLPGATFVVGCLSVTRAL